MERKNAVIMRGKPMTLFGPELKAGEHAPGFESLDLKMNTVKLSDTRGKIRLLASVPSVDTPVCSIETERFNAEAANFPSDKFSFMVISMDLPFALGRFCGSKGLVNVVALSDHLYASFGLAYGVLIKEARLLSRAIFVVDEMDVIRYVEYVKEVSEHPDYDHALGAVKELVAKLAKAA